jgi:hypothetical protein
LAAIVLLTLPAEGGVMSILKNFMKLKETKEGEAIPYAVKLMAIRLVRHSLSLSL